MSNEYAENYYDASLNTYGSTLSGSYAEPLLPPNFTILREYTVGTPRKRQVDWEIHLDENRGPQAQADTFSKGYAGWSSSTADRRFRGYLFNPLKTTTTQFSSGVSEGTGGLFWVNYGQVLVMGNGNDQGALHKETSTSNPAPAQVSYDPNASISSMFVGPIGGATAAERLFIGREGTTTDTHTTIGTSAATMHTDFNSMWGGAVSGVGVTAGTPTWLFYCGQTIKRQPITAAVTDAAASTTLQNIPGGGTVLGIDTLEKSPFGSRMYMFWPKSNVASSWWNSAMTIPLQVWHVTEEGTAPENDYKPSLRPIGGRLWQRNLVVHDYTRVVRFDGETEYDLNIFTNVAANSNLKHAVINVSGSDSVLRALVQKWDLGTAADSRLQWWEFMPQTTSWLPASAEITPLSAGTVSDGAFYLNGLTIGPSSPNLPYSKQHGTAFIRLNQVNDQAFAWQLVNPQGINPFNAYRKTGSSDNASKAFETSSVDTRPAWMLPGRLASKPFSITEIDGRLMDIEAGGSDASVQFQVAMHSTASTALSFTSTPLSVTFKANQGVRERVYKPMAEHRLYRLQVRETLTQGTGETNKTPNGSYGIIRGTSYLDE